MAKKSDEKPLFSVKEGSATIPPIASNDSGIVATTEDSANLGGFKVETPSEVIVQNFARKVEALMNEAVQESIPSQGCPVTVHQERFAHWTNALGDLYREVKQYV